MRYVVACSMAAALLAGCGGGSGGGGSSTPSLKAYVDEVQRLDDTYTGERMTPRGSLPDGKAEYKGVAVIDTALGTSRESGVIGRSRVDADFDENRVSAKLDGFRDPNGDRVDGTVRMDDATLFDDGVLVGAVDGDLDGGDVDGAGEGAFFGKTGKAMQIRMNGTIDGGGSAGSFDGLVRAER